MKAQKPVSISLRLAVIDNQICLYVFCHTYFYLAISVFLAIISQFPVVMGCFGPLNLEYPLTGGPTELIRLCVAIVWHKLLLIGSYVCILLR